jgi:hypothetical protein
LAKNIRKTGYGWFGTVGLKYLPFVTLFASEFIYCLPKANMGYEPTLYNK